MKYGDTRYATTHHYVSIKKSMLSLIKWIILNTIDRMLPQPISLSIKIMTIINKAMKE